MKQHFVESAAPVKPQAETTPLRFATNEAMALQQHRGPTAEITATQRAANQEIRQRQYLAQRAMLDAKPL